MNFAQKVAMLDSSRTACFFFHEMFLNASRMPRACLSMCFWRLLEGFVVFTRLNLGHLWRARVLLERHRRSRQAFFRSRTQCSGWILKLRCRKRPCKRSKRAFAQLSKNCSECLQNHSSCFETCSILLDVKRRGDGWLLEDAFLCSRSDPFLFFMLVSVVSLSVDFLF